MNHAQRMWSAGSLLVIGLLLVIFAVQWDARPPRDEGLRILTIYDTNTTKPFPAGLPAPPPGYVLASGEWLRHGFFVRREWDRSALFWGGLLPLILFAVAGFIALGRRENRA
jgi:hypothetical protein